MSDLQARLQTLQASLIEACSRGREVADVGGFRAMITADDPLEFFSYAMPTGPTTPADVAALVAHFCDYGRVPRLEFCAELWPLVPEQLEGAGFELEMAVPILLLPRDSWTPSVPDPRVRSAVAADSRAMRRVANLAFGMPDAEESESSGPEIARGELLAAIGEIEGHAVGSGFAQGNRRVREVAGIATHPDFRRRGIAHGVISCLLSDFFSQGGELAWLTAGNDGAYALYTKLGFQPVATQVNYRLPR